MKHSKLRVFLALFLFFQRFKPWCSYKKSSYKKKCNELKDEIATHCFALRANSIFMKCPIQSTGPELPSKRLAGRPPSGIAPTGWFCMIFNILIHLKRIPKSDTQNFRMPREFYAFAIMLPYPPRWAEINSYFNPRFSMYSLDSWYSFIQRGFLTLPFLWDVY